MMTQGGGRIFRLVHGLSTLIYPQRCRGGTFSDHDDVDFRLHLPCEKQVLLLRHGRAESVSGRGESTHLRLHGLDHARGVFGRK